METLIKYGSLLSPTSRTTNLGQLERGGKGLGSVFFMSFRNKTFILGCDKSLMLISQLEMSILRSPNILTNLFANFE